jgi:pSer/pThr/pTyr-binding forkhead associated (FHA) protein
MGEIVELTALNGPKEGIKYTFENQDIFILGRADDCTYVINDDKTFSRHHFLIEINSQNATIIDLGSLNGTYVNDKLVGKREKDIDISNLARSKPVLLKDNDIIKAGNYKFVINITKSSENDSNETVFINDASESQENVVNSNIIPDLIINDEDLNKEPCGLIDDLLNDFFSEDEERKTPIGNYKDLVEIGRGSSGIIYKANRADNDKIVAVKTLLNRNLINETEKLKFERELRLTAQLNHKNIIKTYGGSLMGDLYFIEMEYADRGSIYDLLKKNSKGLGLEKSIPIIMDVLDGMAYAHNVTVSIETKEGVEKAKGLVHRDLKPANILLCSEGGRIIAKIADFGLAKAFAAAGMTKGNITKVTNEYNGSYPYFAREHILNYRYIKPVTDVFEAAATFFEMITGEKVWHQYGDKSLIRVILEDNPKLLRKYCPDASNELCAVFDKALAIEPEDRYQDCGEFLKEMRKLYP